ncbi:MAG: regulatory protein RecX [Desulfobacterium sp.]|jgi:regulatory protein|nr:regulatory protein RecX [Desulfobacterium sp.]
MKDSARAYNQALIYLTPRARSIMEARKNLDKKGFSSGVIEETITKLTDHGLLNDRDFAALFVENRERFRPKSKFALGYELKQKGVSNAIIEEVLAGVDERDAALRAVKTKINRWKHLDASTLKKKVLALLRNRGFNYEISMSAYAAISTDKE